jgi:hypothetical protein
MDRAKKSIIPAGLLQEVQSRRITVQDGLGKKSLSAKLLEQQELEV